MGVDYAVNVLYKKHIGDKKPDWQALTNGLKLSLDKAFGPHYHVVGGRYNSFACKNKERTMGMWKSTKTEDNFGVLIWKSPALEMQKGTENSENSETEDQTGSNTEQPARSADASKSAKGTVKVLTPKQIDAESPTSKVIELLKQAVDSSAEEDSLDMLKLFRKQLTKEMGTIWHVILGEDFAVQIPQDAQHFVLAKIGAKKTIACWHHRQLPAGWSLADFQVVLKFAPYILAVVFGIAYLTLNSVCSGDGSNHSKFQLSLRNTFCSEDWERHVMVIVALAMGMIALRRTKILEKMCVPKFDIKSD